VVTDRTGTLLFAEPHETVEPFEDFLSYVQQDSSQSDTSRNVKYAQPRTNTTRTSAQYL
jgi:jumonji domain-containing protein 7